MDRTTAKVREEQNNFEELMETMEEILGKTKEGRTEAEFWQDKEAIEVLKRQFREQESETHDRQLQRQAGVAHQLQKLKGELGDEKEEISKITESRRTLGNPKGEESGSEEKRMMGFGEYHHWHYGSVVREKPNYAAYLGMESERISEPQKQFQEWMQKKRAIGLIWRK